MIRAGRDRQVHRSVWHGRRSPVGHRPAANRLRTAWLAIFALLLHTWLPLALLLADAAAVQHRAAADQMAGQHAGAHGAELAPATPEPAPVGGHHAPGDPAGDIKCPLCIVGQLAKALPGAAGPVLPIVVAARHPGFRLRRRRVPYQRPIRMARPRAPPSPADPR